HAAGAHEPVGGGGPRSGGFREVDAARYAVHRELVAQPGCPHYSADDSASALRARFVGQGICGAGGPARTGGPPSNSYAQRRTTKFSTIVRSSGRALRRSRSASKINFKPRSSCWAVNFDAVSQTCSAREPHMGTPCR